MLPQSALVVFRVYFFVCLRGIFCASYLPFVLSSMHGLLCFSLFGLSKLLLQIQFPFTIHPAHSSEQPCCLLLSLTHEYPCAHRGTSGHGASGWFLGAGSRGSVRVGDGGALCTPQSGPHCKPSKPQQSTKPYTASFGSRGAQGPGDLLVFRSQALVRDSISSSMNVGAAKGSCSSI